MSLLFFFRPTTKAGEWDQSQPTAILLLWNAAVANGGEKNPQRIYIFKNNGSNTEDQKLSIAAGSQAMCTFKYATLWTGGDTVTLKKHNIHKFTFKA